MNNYIEDVINNYFDGAELIDAIKEAAKKLDRSTRDNVLNFISLNFK